MPKAEKWKFYIDRGGTFTDVIARDPYGIFHTKKLLSENPQHYSNAARHAIRQIFDLSETTPIPTDKIDEIKMGTTVATNALLERKGVKCALIITAGLRDILEIGVQARDDIFAMQIRKPRPLYQDVLEIDERLDAHGKIINALNEEQARAGLQHLYNQGFRSLAIAFMHSHLNPVHEDTIARIAKTIGFTQISPSSSCGRLQKLIPRGQTAVIDAYLHPILAHYTDQIAQALHGVDIAFMQSSGGLANIRQFKARNAVFSGPAGGVIAAVKTAQAAGFDKIIGFDMGGTSTDVFHYAGGFERTEDTQISGQFLRVPMLEIHTVAAGGGSILGYDGARFSVGPDSAGASPGPTSYRGGGPLAVTDINVVLGKINPDLFPSIFGPNQDQPIDVHTARNQFKTLAKACGKSLELTAAGFLEVAVDHMARAIKKISTSRGILLDDYSLICFGGAGGQHACLVAENLGIKSILIHPLGGLLSAYGMGLADHIVHKQRSVNLPIDKIGAARTIAQMLIKGAHTDLQAQGIKTGQVKVIALMRIAGSDTKLPIELDGDKSLKSRFETAHQARFSYIDKNAEILIDSLSVSVSGGGNPAEPIPLPEQNRKTSPVPVFSKNKWHDTPVYLRTALAMNTPITGPALILDPGGTNMIEPGWQVIRRSDNILHLTRTQKNTGIETKIQDVPKHGAYDPVRLEIMNNIFMAIAEQMGTVLQNTATSVNIKERLDFSCAVFDKHGGLVANAPHMPVHIGSMDASINALLKSGLPLSPGDSFVHNNPYDGGTHLPDINVITPVFINPPISDFPNCKNPVPDYYVVSRGHHADIGGLAPGSMSPLAETIWEEGVVIDCTWLVKNGIFQEKSLRESLASGQFPARNPKRNLSDLKAQLAANAKGALELATLCQTIGMGVVDAYMEHAQNYGEACVRRAICALTSGTHVYTLDQGSQIKVRITVNPQTGSARIDFTGTDPQRPDNFNAPEAVTHAAVLYVFRCLVGDNIPLNAGCLRPLKIVIPKASLLSPSYPAAIVAGNVEISQAVTNALFSALGVLGTSQGTMNNFTFGNDSLQYYETICSGAPAGPDFDGVAAIQTHMTNSRMTDPEVLETRYPVRLQAFTIKRNSGGCGQYNAGDGVRRVIEFLEPMECAILSGNREIPCAGIKGGDAGELGRNLVIRTNGKTEILSGCARTQMAPGDQFIIETPTGGGYGFTKNRTISSCQ